MQDTSVGQDGFRATRSGADTSPARARRSLDRDVEDILSRVSEGHSGFLITVEPDVIDDEAEWEARNDENRLSLAQQPLVMVQGLNGDLGTLIFSAMQGAFQGVGTGDSAEDSASDATNIMNVLARVLGDLPENVRSVVARSIPEDEFDAVSEVVSSTGAPRNEDVCPICYVPLFSKEKEREDDDTTSQGVATTAGHLRRTRCGHTFCGPCLETWMRRSTRCPMCMIDLTAR